MCAWPTRPPLPPSRPRFPTTIRCRCTASTTSSCTSATPRRPPTSTPTRSASSASPTAASRPASATQVSHVLQQGRIRLVLTGALRSDSDIAAHQRKHGDGVKVIALSVPDVDHAYREATARGAEGVTEPHDLTDEHGTVRLAAIRTYGDTLHTFVDRDGYDGAVPARLQGRRGRHRGQRHAARDRPHRRQRRARRDGRVGQVLRGRLRDDGDDPLLRRRPRPSTRR